MMSELTDERMSLLLSQTMRVCSASPDQAAVRNVLSVVHARTKD